MGRRIFARNHIFGRYNLIEADGAKRLPFKFPKQNEPVYISSSNKVVYIVGMSALNQPLKSLCRAELLAKFLQKQVNENLTKMI